MFQPEIALVCGASKGNGAALIPLLIQKYPLKHIFAVSRSGSVVATTQQLAKEYHCQLHSVSCNIEEEEDLNELRMRIQEFSPQIHLLVNTVGFLSDEEFQPEKNISSLSHNALLNSISKNTWPALGLMKHLRPLFRHKNPLRMIFYSARVGSISDNGLGGWYSYRISKAALNMAVRTFSIELARSNPQLCCFSYHPGTVDTELSRPFTRRYTKNTIFSPEQAAQYMLDVLALRSPEDNGGFYDWKGERLEY